MKLTAIYISRPPDPIEAAEVQNMALKHGRSLDREAIFFTEDAALKKKPILTFLKKMDAEGLINLHIIWLGDKPDFPVVERIRSIVKH